jgi:secondary thiamine-phosphate synthase enzyme
MKLISIQTSQREELVDITEEVQNLIRERQVEEGIAIVYTPHTTTAIIVNENYDPSVRLDLLSKLRKLIPYEDSYKHIEGNSDAHIKSSIIGNTRTIMISENRMLLGTWEGIFFCEFDGPRDRNVYIKIIKEF